VGVPELLGSYTDAVARFGAYDRWVDGASGELTLVRALEQAYRFGATTVWAVRVADTNAAAATVDAGGQALMQEAILPSVAAGLAGGPASPMERTSRLNDLEESLR
jgi:hypothetical protein